MALRNSTGGFDGCVDDVAEKSEEKHPEKKECSSVVQDDWKRLAHFSR